MPNKKIFVMMNLGDIVTPNLQNGVEALTKTVVDTVGSSFPVSDFKNFFPKVSSTVFNSQNVINGFKSGAVNEKEFNTEFLEKLKSFTGIEIKAENLDNAWNKMNPSYEEFAENLKTLSKFKEHMSSKTEEKGEHVEFALFTFSNPKDERYLATQLITNNVPCEIEVSEKGVIKIKSIMGIPLFDTFNSKKTKNELINDYVESNKKYLGDKFFDGPRNTECEFKYIASHNADKSNHKNVENILWDKTIRNLEGILFKAIGRDTYVPMACIGRATV